MLRITTKNTIIKMMKENPVIIDDHDGKEKAITGLVEFVGPKPLACCFDAHHYSLNMCYIDDDKKLHCDEASIGDVLWGGYPDAEQLKRYNNNCIFDGGKIKCIHRPDGTVIYPAE